MNVAKHSPWRAQYVGNCVVPGPGTIGAAWPADGHDDPESCQYEAYLFQPDGDENAYYVDPVRDLRDAPSAVAGAA